MKILFCVLFALVSLAHLYGCFPPQKRVIRRYTKPLVMPMLLGSYAFFVSPPSLLPVLALAFLCVGNSFLLAPEKQLFVRISYVAFSVAAALMAFTFLVHLGSRPSFLFSAIAVVLYAAAIAVFLYLLAPYLPPDLTPFFSVVTCLTFTMSLMALFFAFTNAGAAPKLVFVGSVLYLAAGVVHSLHLFRKRNRFGNFYMMLSYISGTALMIFGLIGFGGI